MTVHFPIGLLLMATVLSVVMLAAGKKQGLVTALRWSLYGGSVFLWIAIFTGNLADGEVSRSLCDPTVMKQHENFAYYTASLFTAISVLEILSSFRLWNFRKWLLALLILIGVAMMTFVGHLGASLVYEQAAGVEVPSPDCDGF